MLISTSAFSEISRSPNEQMIEIDIPVPPKDAVGYDFSQK
jgi:hypothetical protein